MLHRLKVETIFSWRRDERIKAVGREVSAKCMKWQQKETVFFHVASFQILLPCCASISYRLRVLHRYRAEFPPSVGAMPP
jgi:hypothetical protein